MVRPFDVPSKRPPKISLLVPVHDSPELLEENVPILLSFFSAHYGERFEIILIPNPILKDTPTLTAARKLARRHLKVRVCPTAVLPGKGLALKEGFGMARGRLIYTIDADLPYDLGFFLDAEKLLERGFHLVLGNRRLPVSRFRMPVGVLKLVYRRFLVGLWFNRALRLFFPVGTSDTQAGIRAMTRDTAEAVFRRQVCPSFMHDVEMILTVRETGRRLAELPVLLHLKTEKSTVRILRAGLDSLFWLSRIAWLRAKGHYSNAPL